MKIPTASAAAAIAAAVANVLILLPSTLAARPGDSEYTAASLLLQDTPQFHNKHHYNSDNKVVMNVPMDYDPEYHVSHNQEILEHLPKSQLRAYELLDQSAELGNVDANFLLAEINMYGNYSYPTNASIALKYYSKVAELEPNATAYFNIAFLYSTGAFGEVPIDQAKANLYYNFAFNQGDLRAGMVLGYRYSNGISVEYNCRLAMFYYQAVADRLNEIYENSPIGGPVLDSYAVRISDFKGGIYGKGVDVSSSSLTRKANRYDYLLSGSYAGNDEALFDSLYWLVLNEYEGSYLKKRDFKTAFTDAKYIMDKAIKTDNLIDMDKKHAAICIFLLGKMYMRGEGTEQDFGQAVKHFEKSIEFHPLAEAYNDLGLIYEFGPESIRDPSKLPKMYKKARTCPNGSFNFGRWLINMGNSTGIDFIEQAFAYRDIPAMYYLNELNSVNQVTPCETSLGMLKYYVERFDPIVTSLEWSFFEMIYGRPQNALIGYAMAAEQGYESAQASAAYLLYQLPDLFAEESESMPPRERLDMAITYLTRSSKTFNIESANVLGDIYSNLEEYEKALVAYDHAATKSSSQAHFNLGWLYENGYGCDKDFNLAKRHYDLALSYNPRAYLVVKLSLLKLRVKSFINDITGGTINGIHNDNDGGGQIQKKTSWRDWMELYRKVKDSSFGTSSNPDNNEDSANKPAFDQESSYNLENNGNETDDDDDDDSESEYEDFLLLSIFILAMAGFMLFHFLNQRQIRRQPNGINVPGNRDPQFNFRIIAI